MIELRLQLSHGLPWHPEILDSGGAEVSATSICYFLRLWSTACFLQSQDLYLSGAWNYRWFVPATKQSSSFSKPADVNAVWMMPQSFQQDKEMEKQGSLLFPKGVSDLLVYLGVSCGQTRATAASWILFSACLSLPYPSHPFLGGKVALCATSALSLWQCQAVNTLHLDLMTSQFLFFFWENLYYLVV